MNKDDLLYHYFSNSLTKVQEEEFESLLESDSDFKKRFMYESDLKRAIKEKRHRDLKAKLNAFENSVNTSESKKFSINFIKIAAAVVIFLGVGWFSYQNFFGLNYNDLYVTNFETYPNTVYTITRSDTINSLERQAFVAYESENFDVALSKFEMLESKDYIQFYKAQSYLSMQNYKVAKDLFLEVISNNKVFVDEAKWYLALVYLREKDTSNALKYLSDLKESSLFNYEKVVKLLHALQ